MAEEGDDEVMDISTAAADESSSKPSEAPKPAKRATYELPWYATIIHVNAARKLEYSGKLSPYFPRKLKDREIPANQVEGGGGK